MAHIIKTDGSVIDITPKNGTDFKLKELNDIVGGYVEIVYLNESGIMVLNEEGKLLDLPINDRATIIFQAMTDIDDFIVGDVLICNNEQVK